MNQRKKGPWRGLLLLAFSGLILQQATHPVYAAPTEESTSQTETSSTESAGKDPGGVSELADKTGFLVEALPPDSQIDPNFSFFYARTKPLEEQTLKVKVTSTQKKKATAKIDITNAVTNSTGQIDYGQTNAQLDKSMTLPLTEMVTSKEKEVTVENFEEKIVELSVKPPKESYEGVRLGAVVFSAVEKDTDSKGVTSSYGYKIGIMLSEDLRPYNEGASLTYTGVKARLENGQKVVALTVQNPTPYVLENLTIQSKVTKKGSKEVLTSNQLGGMKMAPNSSFDFLNYLGLEKLQPGTYQMTASATDGAETWTWEKEFTISDNQAEKLNKEAAYQLLLPNLYKILGGLLILLTLLTMGYLIYRKKGGKEGEEH